MLTSKILVAVALCVILCVSMTALHAAPPYEDKRDRFSFAQLYLSADVGRYQPKISGSDARSVDIPSVTIGGLHYWGHADFYVRFAPRNADAKLHDGTRFTPGTETGFHFYPKPLTDGSVRPYFGFGFYFPAFSRVPNTRDKIRRLHFPLHFGATYMRHPYLMSLDLASAPGDVPLQNGTGRLESPTISLRIKRAWDVSLSARRHAKGDLPRGVYPYIGIGPSSAWLTRTSNNSNAPDIRENPTVLPEVSAGLNIKGGGGQGVRNIVNLSLRPQKIKTDDGNYKNRSISLEAMRSFGDYHGFVPFAGLSVSQNALSFKGRDERITRPGIVFGWDILPDHGTNFMLRTTLRYYNKIAMRDGTQFPNFEFNFIQAVWQFGSG